MGEAKRREELGLPPRQKNESNKSDRYLSWLPITKSRINEKYVAAFICPPSDLDNAVLYIKKFNIEKKINKNLVLFKK